LRSHRVFVHAALRESFGIALVEAMAEGVPICAGPVGGIVEAFSDGSEGFYWDLDDPPAGAQSLIALMETPGLRQKMAEAALERFEANYETYRVAGRLTNFILGLGDEPALKPRSALISR
jgi:glycosyltransferase involved in cell wall biosynthesis